MAKNGKSTKHRKTREFLAAGLVAGRGRGPSLLRRGENCRTARTRPGGPWPDLSAYARQPARGPTMLANCWPASSYSCCCCCCGGCGCGCGCCCGCWLLVAGWLLVGGGWLLVVGCWAHFVPSWSHVSPSWAHVAPFLGLCSLILGLILWLRWPMLASC